MSSAPKAPAKDPYREKESKRSKPNNEKTGTAPQAIPSTSTAGISSVTKETVYDVTDSDQLRDEPEQWEDPLTEVATDTPSTQPLIAETNVPTFRILRRITKHVTRAEYNAIKLQKLLDNKHLPKGLSPKRFPLNLPDTPIDIQLKWERAHVELSKSLTAILQEYWQKRYNSLSEDQEDLWTSLRDNCTREEFTHITSLINKTKDETIQRINDAEKKKADTTEEMETEETTTEEKDNN